MTERDDARCPVCGVELTLQREAGGHTWRCGPCASAAVPISRLRRERDAGVVSQAWAAARAPAVATGVGCVFCRKPSGRVVVEVPDAVVSIDVCARCQLAWVSDASLARIPARPRPPSLAPNELPPEAKVAYAQAIASMWRDRIRDDRDRERAVTLIEGITEAAARLTT